MEHLVRVYNELDRRTLEWLRASVGDAAITAAVHRCGSPSKPYLSWVCRSLGVTAPRFSAQRHAPPSAVGDRSLSAIREILAKKTRLSAHAPAQRH